MDETKQNGFITFIKRLLLIMFITVVAVLICYSCSAINSVSNYTINLEKATGSVFEAENQQTVLIINSPTGALINTSYEDLSGLYDLEQKNNVLFLTRGAEENKTELVFVSLSGEELFWQNKNLILYKWEE